MMMDWSVILFLWLPRFSTLFDYRGGYQAKSRGKKNQKEKCSCNLLCLTCAWREATSNSWHETRPQPDSVTGELNFTWYQSNGYFFPFAYFRVKRRDEDALRTLRKMHDGLGAFAHETPTLSITDSYWWWEPRKLFQLIWMYFQETSLQSWVKI